MHVGGGGGSFVGRPFFILGSCGAAAHAFPGALKRGLGRGPDGPRRVFKDVHGATLLSATGGEGVGYRPTDLPPYPRRLQYATHFCDTTLGESPTERNPYKRGVPKDNLQTAEPTPRLRAGPTLSNRSLRPTRHFPRVRPIEGHPVSSCYVSRLRAEPPRPMCNGETVLRLYSFRRAYIGSTRVARRAGT